MKQREQAGIPWPGFAVTVAAAFMVALDPSIVNVAFPSICRSSRGRPSETTVAVPVDLTPAEVA